MLERACWVALCGYGLVDSRLTVTACLYPQAVSGNRSICGVILTFAAPRDFCPQKQAWLMYGIHDCDRFFLQSFTSCSPWSSSPDAFLTICLSATLLFFFILHFLSTAPAHCAPLLSPSDFQCNIHNGAEDTHEGHTQKKHLFIL